MVSTENNSSPEIGNLGPLYKSAWATAIIGAIFSTVILTLMVANYVQGRVREVRLEKKLEAMKLELAAGSAEESLTDEIRLSDLEFRRSRLPRPNFTKIGAFLLLGSLAIFVLGIKWADTIKKKMPVPDSEQPGAPEQVTQADMARKAIAVVAAVTVVLALALILIPKVDFSATNAADASYPSREQIAKNWHRFHGIEGAGVVNDANIPDDWDGETNRGILWKTKVPVIGHNSPIVWGDRVFLSGGDANNLNVFCFDADSGDLLWTGDVERTLPKTEDEEEFEPMEDTGFAACTMATDGRRVYAIFATGDLACFDFSGKNLWTKSLGIPDSVYGYASSLETYKNMVIVQYDQGDAESAISRLFAFDGFSGSLVWEAKRPVANSWSSPILAYTETGLQIITAADPNVMGYDPNTGTELWRAELLAGDVAPSPVYANGLAFFIEPYSKIAAVKTDGKGDVTKTHIVWSADEPGPDIATPLTDGNFLFVLNTDGLALNFNCPDGKKLWEADIREDFMASPNLVNGKLYLLTDKGIMIIAEAMPKYKELKRCKLGERVHASPAFANGRIYIRGLENLYCIGKEEPKEN